MADRSDPLKDARDHYDTHDSLTGEAIEFPDRNLDVLRERTASGMPERPSTQDRLAGLEAAVDEAVLGELETIDDLLNKGNIGNVGDHVSARIAELRGDGGG